MRQPGPQMVAHPHGKLTVRQVYVDVHRTDHEVVEHRTVLRHTGAIPRVVGDGGGFWCDDGGPGRAQPQAFRDGRSRDRRPEPGELVSQLTGFGARCRPDLDLASGELTAHLVAQIRFGSRDDGGRGRLRTTTVRVDEQELL